ncbi:MAG: hypothetical protein V1489_01125 [Candidatus Liptonbacteria bacterium]
MEEDMNSRDRLYHPARDVRRKDLCTWRRVERMRNDPKGTNIPDVWVKAKLREIEAAGLIRVTDELSLALPALARIPDEEVLARYPFIHGEDGIERNVSPEGPVTSLLATVLRDSEQWVDGPEYELRVKPHLAITLGLPQGLYLVENQDKPKLAAFKALCEKVYIDLHGIRVVNGSGHRSVGCLRGSGGRWYLNWDRLASRVYQDDRIAVSGK